MRSLDRSRIRSAVWTSGESASIDRKNNHPSGGLARRRLRARSLAVAGRGDRRLLRRLARPSWPASNPRLALVALGLDAGGRPWRVDERLGQDLVHVLDRHDPELVAHL